MNFIWCLSFILFFFGFGLFFFLDFLIFSGCNGLYLFFVLDGFKNLVNLDFSDCVGFEFFLVIFGRKDVFFVFEKFMLCVCDKVVLFLELEDGVMLCFKFFDLSGWV